MTAADLVLDLKARGVRLTAEGNRLQYDAPAGVMTPDLLARLKACKSELLATLAPCVAEAFPVVQSTEPTVDADAQGATPPKDPAVRQAEPCSDAGILQALATAWDPPPEPRPAARAVLYDVDGLRITFTERAAYWRAGWAANGYPPGVRPRC